MDKQWYINKIKRQLRESNGYAEDIISHLDLDSMNEKQLYAVSFMSTIISVGKSRDEANIKIMSKSDVLERLQSTANDIKEKANHE